MHPDTIHFERIINSLDKSFSEANLADELVYFERSDTGTSFERPYGLAWFLQLTSELREWDHPKAKEWLAILHPLENKIIANISDWLPKLSFPIRGGEHSQTAFAFGLMLDFSEAVNNRSFKALVETTVLRLYENDINCPLAYEPSGQDFLSPCIAEADLMRRVFAPQAYAKWLSEFLPNIPNTVQSDWLAVATVSDKSDGKLAHLDGLNLSRAWMLEGIALGLPSDDKRIPAILQAAEAHKTAGIKSVTTDMHYMGSHWLESFATYLTTKRGQ